MALNDQQLADFSEITTALGIKHKLSIIAAREIRKTPDYAQAKANGVARQWLDDEAKSAAEMMYAALMARLEDLDPA